MALHERRQVLDRDAAQPLDDYVNRDPISEAGRDQLLAHLFVVGVPRPGRSEMLLEVVNRQERWQPFLYTLVHGRANHEPRFGSKWAPDFNSASNWSTRGDGWAASSYDLAAGRLLAENAREKNIIEIELTEEGACRLFCGRASDLPDPSRSPDYQVLFEQIIAGLTYRTVQLAGDIAADSEYHGAWAFGVALTGARGHVSSLLNQNIGTPGTPYSADEYRALTRASSQELKDAPGMVTNRLVGRMLRTLGSHRAPQLDAFLGRDTIG